VCVVPGPNKQMQRARIMHKFVLCLAHGASLICGVRRQLDRIASSSETAACTLNSSGGLSRSRHSRLVRRFGSFRGYGKSTAGVAGANAKGLRP